MTLVLSQLTLNLSQRDVRRDLGNAYDMHRTLAKAFADGPTSKVRQFLWRLEPSRSAESPQLLVQSESDLVWSALPLDYLLHQAQRSWTPEDVLLKGRRLRFSLRANPTVNRVPPNKEGQVETEGSARGRRKRLGLWNEVDQLAWLKRQAERIGLTSVEADVTTSERLQCRRQGSLLTVAAAQFEGQAVIEDPMAISAGIRTGVGHARMMGLGLVSVAPLRN